MADLIEIDSSGRIDYYSEPVEVEPIQENTVQIVENQQLLNNVVSDNSIDSDIDQEVENDNSAELSENEKIDSVIISNEDIINVLKEINENVQKDSTVSDNVISDPVDDQVISVSQNEILTKNLSDYTVSESLQLLIFLTLLISGLVFIIRKGLYRWT